ncbi:MAG: hypothetical protein ACTSUE_12520 [Promethearchaeota archaeon]
MDDIVPPLITHEPDVLFFPVSCENPRAGVFSRFPVVSSRCQETKGIGLER